MQYQEASQWLKHPRYSGFFLVFLNTSYLVQVFYVLDIDADNGIKPHTKDETPKAPAMMRNSAGIVYAKNSQSNGETWAEQVSHVRGIPTSTQSLCLNGESGMFKYPVVSLSFPDDYLSQILYLAANHISCSLVHFSNR